MTIDRAFRLSAILGVVALLGANPSVATAQTNGRVVGRILDAAHGTPLAGAQVGIAGSTIAATTSLDGRFILLHVPAGGEIELRARMIGYQPKAVSGVVVPTTGGVEQNITLTAEVFQLEGITVTASAEKGTVSAALEEVRNAPALMNTLPAEMMRKSPDSDAGQAVQRVAGVSVQDGKYVFVRGLGERYTTTSLNNARIPSPEPERKVVPLDLFPSSLLEAITTSKTFTPEQPGDFSGAQVNLKTREFPLGRKVSISSSVGYNDAATGKDILRAPTVGQERLGLAGSARALPSGFLGVPANLNGVSLAQTNTLIASFRDVWSANHGKGMPNTGFGASVGGEDPVFGHSLGYLGSLTYSLSEDTHRNERRALAVADGTGNTRPLNEYRGSTGTAGVLWGGLLNLSTRLGTSTKLSINNAYTQSADNQASRFAGINEELGPIDVTRLTFTERTVRSNQFVAEKLIGGRHTLDIAITSSGVRRYEPDRSDLVYVTNVDTATGVSQPIAFYPGARAATRTFSDLTESSWDGAANFKLMFGSSRSLKIGALGRMADRDADTRAYDVLSLGLTDADRAQPVANVLSDQNAIDGKLFLSPSANAGVYTATERLGAGYAQFDLAFLTRFRFVGGARIEHEQLRVNSRNPQGGESHARLNNTDVLPSVALSIQLTGSQNLRLSATQTLSRPEYRELSDVSYADIVGGLVTRGNPDLKRALIQNLDLRWEFYPGASEVISAGVFAKHFSHPIEKILRGTTGAPELGFVNAEGANNYGAELEVRETLGRLSESLHAFNVFANTTVMHSRIVPGTDNSQTNAERAMVGQAKYVVNGGLGYSSGRVNATLLYNVVGRRIVEAGLLPRPDTYEEARNVVDFSLELPFIAGGQLKMDGKNLLDAPYRTIQGSVTRNEFTTGRSFSMGLSWTL